MRRLRVLPAFALVLGWGCSQPTGPEHPIEGKRLYDQYCARCHGVDGVPTKEAPTASSFADPQVVERLSDESIKGVIRGGKGQMPGFGELFRWLSFRQIGTSTIQSRADAWLCDSTLVFVVPGSTGACRLAMDRILVEQLDNRHRPCNFVELLPRIRGG